jgi:hypothetical protein
MGLVLHGKHVGVHWLLKANIFITLFQISAIGQRGMRGLGHPFDRRDRSGGTLWGQRRAFYLLPDNLE